MSRKTLWVIGMVAAACAAGAADVVIVKPGARKTALDIQALGESGGEASAVFRKTLADDLTRSGWFTLVGRGSGVIEVGGSISESGKELAVQCDAKNTASGKMYLSRKYSEGRNSARTLAHRVADDLVKAIKNVSGIAATRIAMIGSVGGRQDIFFCDAAGTRLVQVTRDGAVCLTPSWGPEADRIVYTSFLGGFPDVFEIDLNTNTRERIAGFPGLNAGADVSPDGRSIVLTLSKDGNPDLYIMDLRARTVKRLTRTRFAAEASPRWSPDGNRVVFVSDRAGSPQLYIVDRKTGVERRLTRQGRENVTPDWGPDGRIVYSSRRGARFQICVIDPDGGDDGIPLTTENADHEGPSWAPDGRHIVFSKTVQFHSDLYILDTLGDTPIRLTFLQGDWYSPAWSPK